MFTRKNHTFVGRLKSESNQPFNFLPRVQGDGGHVSIWGCMSGGASAPLIIYSGKINEPAYIEIIEEALPTFIETHSIHQINNEYSCRIMHHDTDRPTQ